MIKQTLHGNWTVRAVGDLSEMPAHLRDLIISAKVPGCVHTDLLRAGKIPDPYLDRNEFSLQWIGQTDWEYRTTFGADPKLFEQERIDLVADGLDTVARIELNGQLVGETQNMHRGYRFDVRSRLRRRESNELTITFLSPVKYALAMREKLTPRPYVNGPAGPFNFIRKMAANFGWDWGPGLPTCGIWRGMRLEGWEGARIERVRTRFDGNNVLSVEMVYEMSSESHLVADVVESLELPNGRIITESSGSWHGNPRSWEWLYELEDPQLWWPVGYGGQPLYKLRVRCDRDERRLMLGLRTVELDTSPTTSAASSSSK